MQNTWNFALTQQIHPFPPNNPWPYKFSFCLSYILPLSGLQIPTPQTPSAPQTSTLVPRPASPLADPEHSVHHVDPELTSPPPDSSPAATFSPPFSFSEEPPGVNAKARKAYKHKSHSSDSESSNNIKFLTTQLTTRHFS